MSETWTRITPPKTEEKNDSEFWRAKYMAMISERDAERKALKAANEKTEELERTHSKNRGEKFEAERMWRFFEAEYVDMVTKKNAARKELFVANEKIGELENQIILLEIENDKLRAEKSND